MTAPRNIKNYLSLFAAIDYNEQEVLEYLEEFDDPDQENTPEGWQAYMPALITAIASGYLDEHLQTLGKAARRRLIEIDPSVAQAKEAVKKPSTPPAEDTSNSSKVLGMNGYVLPILRRNVTSDTKTKPGEVRGPSAYEATYDKASMIGQKAAITWSRLGSLPNLYEIVAVGRSKFMAKLVWPHPNNGAAASRQVGKTIQMEIDYNKNLFEKP